MNQSAANARSFGQQWAGFEYQRTWGGTIADRRTGFLADIGQPPDWFEGRRVLDAGCGAGTLSYAISTLGCEVVGIDVSSSVVAARERFPVIEFIQADISDPPDLGLFDVIYSGSVLHHLPDPHAAFGKLVPLLAPGGFIYVWLYWRVAGRTYAFKSALRRLPLPYSARRLLSVPFALQGAMRDRSLSLREHRLAQHDFFTPRWRSEHTPEEVLGWCEEFSLRGTLRSTSRDGFGVLARHYG